jgi:hypothetical protein
MKRERKRKAKIKKIEIKKYWKAIVQLKLLFL